jgi:hypothetical protein
MRLVTHKNLLVAIVVTASTVVGGCATPPPAKQSMTTKMLQDQYWEACQNTPKEFRADCEKQYIRSQCASQAGEVYKQYDYEKRKEQQQKQAIGTGIAMAGSLIPFAGVGVIGRQAAMGATGAASMGVMASGRHSALDGMEVGGPFDKAYRECLKRNGVDYTSAPPPNIK